MNISSQPSKLDHKKNRSQYSMKAAADQAKVRQLLSTETHRFRGTMTFSSISHNSVWKVESTQSSHGGIVPKPARMRQRMGERPSFDRLRKFCNLSRAGALLGLGIEQQVREFMWAEVSL